MVLAGPAEGARLPLAPVRTLGRGRDADLRVRDPHASRVHARFRVGCGGAAVEDLGSKNGVLVNGRRIGEGARALRPGDRIALGGSLFAYADPLAEVERGAASARAAGGPGAAQGAPALPRAPRPALRLAAAALLAAAATALALAG